MIPRYLTVDGMLSGTGVRDSIAGGYLDPLQLGLDEDFVNRIEQWLLRYENAHFNGFEDEDECTRLDQFGLQLSCELQGVFPQSKIEYFSHARQIKLPISS